jgi:hypothetical protein
MSVWRSTRRSARGEQPDEGVEVDEKNDQIALRRIVAGREILRNDERNSNSPETRYPSPDKRSRNRIRAAILRNTHSKQI